ncbi:MAG: LysR family transcriptional regulator [Acidobacteriota bacterium]
MLDALRLFCDVARLRSFSEAAELHGITQSAVSQRIRSLEAELGVRLFDRSVRPPALLPSGELLVREGHQLVARWNDLAHRVTQLEQTVEGPVKVVAIYSAGIGLLKSVQEHFEHSFPGVKVSLEYQRPEQVAAAVAAGLYDVGITSYPTRWRQVRNRPLRDERMVAVCAAEHPLAGRKSVKARRLDRYRLAGFETTLPVSKAIGRYLKDNGVRPHFANHVDNIDTMKSLLAYTDLVALLPERTVLSEVEAGTLASVRIEPSLTRPVGVVFAHDRSLTPAASAFIDFLVQHAGPRDAPGQPIPPVGNKAQRQLAG